MLLGGHVKAVFTLITIIFIICVTCTVTSFDEMPLETLQMSADEENTESIQLKDEQTNMLTKPEVSYGTLVDEVENKVNNMFEKNPKLRHHSVGRRGEN